MMVAENNKTHHQYHQLEAVRTKELEELGATGLTLRTHKGGGLVNHARGCGGGASQWSLHCRVCLSLQQRRDTCCVSSTSAISQCVAPIVVKSIHACLGFVENRYQLRGLITDAGRERIERGRRGIQAYVSGNVPLNSE